MSALWFVFGSRVVVALMCLVLGASGPVSAQRPVPVSSWVTELGGGAAADLVARGPWMAEDWRRRSERRILFATALSLVYEYVIEPWNGQTNAAKWQDAGQRLVGTLATELVIAFLRLSSRADGSGP